MTGTLTPEAGKEEGEGRAGWEAGGSGKPGQAGRLGGQGKMTLGAGAVFPEKKEECHKPSQPNCSGFMKMSLQTQTYLLNSDGYKYGKGREALGARKAGKKEEEPGSG